MLSPRPASPDSLPCNWKRVAAVSIASRRSGSRNHARAVTCGRGAWGYGSVLYEINERLAISRTADVPGRYVRRREWAASTEVQKRRTVVSWRGLSSELSGPDESIHPLGGVWHGRGEFGVGLDG